MKTQEISELNKRFEIEGTEALLLYFLEKYDGRIALSSSLGLEDQVLTHMLAGIDISARIFTLDTGRLFPETYDLIHKTAKRYKIDIEVLFPDANTVEEMVKKYGINLFYDSVENRKRCCHVRKIEPSRKAYKGIDAWISGLRKSQSDKRNNVSLVEWDDANDMLKVNPLANWTGEQVWNFIQENNIPYNPLHDKGYPSIGCLPCTRSIMPGEDTRAGRWWWESPNSKECGLHVKDRDE